MINWCLYYLSHTSNSLSLSLFLSHTSNSLSLFRTFSISISLFLFHKPLFLLSFSIISYLDFPLLFLCFPPLSLFLSLYFFFLLSLSLSLLFIFPLYLSLSFSFFSLFHSGHCLSILLRTFLLSNPPKKSAIPSLFTRESSFARAMLFQEFRGKPSLPTTCWSLG